ncbi:MAG: hypothetical protein Unbinned4834contig1000_28 [Prokaryotic dsDNA virus sp.]|nr:MAG: hypothetical protein Unbinned4834contig1000_28 [Prokaryotic dsDNA virus sp.]|tara:strand:- start:31297 stop:31443 length:147 start_codon:yes stop_codon:yes gene_type:complete
MKITASIEIDTQDPDSVEDIIEELQQIIDVLYELTEREIKNKEGRHDS